MQCDPCIRMSLLSLLSWVHSLELEVDLENSLDWIEGVSGRALIHGLQSFPKKADGIYLTTSDKGIAVGYRH